MTNDPKRSRGIAEAMIGAVESATAKWTRQKKSEERHPGMARYRRQRLTREPKTTQRDAVFQVLEAAYMAASNNGTLPASARQIYYQVRPKVMELTENKHLDYGYFSQTLLPDYIDERGEQWDVVFDARGSLQEPHTSRKIACGTIAIGNYMGAMREPEVVAAAFEPANISTIGPAGNVAGVLFIEKEGFAPLFAQVDLANRFDLMIMSTKGMSNTASRSLIEEVCGRHGVPLFTLHDFDTAGSLIAATLQKDTRRYRFATEFEVVDLGLRIEDIEGLEREPAAASKVKDLRQQLSENGATNAEVEILLHERVELNAMTSAALVAMIERKLKGYGLKKVIPSDALLRETYKAFHHSNELHEAFDKMEAEFEATRVRVPKTLRHSVSAILKTRPGLRWDDAVRLVLDADSLDDVLSAKQETKEKSGDFDSADDEA